MTKSRKSTRTTLLNILCFIGITLFGKVGFADATFTISSIEDTAIWPHVDAISINVHGSQGEWIETIPGDSNSWLAPKTGAYFFVATNGGHWSTWPRSNLLYLNNSPSRDKTDNELNEPLLDNVSGIVYSNTALELFWDYSPDYPNSSVSIHRNGERLIVTEGRSLYESGLEPGTTYNYTLYPSDEVGRNRKVVELQLTTTGSSLTTPITAAPIDETYLPEPPQNLRIDVYSGTALELFWDRVSDEQENGIAYAIYRDGELITDTWLGNSYFVTDLTPGTTYIYSVEAVANSLESSIRSDVTATTLGVAPALQNPGLLFDQDTQPEVLATLFRELSGERLNRLGSQLQFLISEVARSATEESVIEQEEEVTSNGNDEIFTPDIKTTFIAEYTCQSGGSMSVSRSNAIDYLIPGILIDTSERTTFAKCKFEVPTDTNGLSAGSYELSGEYYLFEDLNSYKRSESNTTTNEFNNLSLKKPDNTVLVTTANSSEENSASFSGPASKPISKTWSIATYTETNSQGSEVFSLSDSSWRQSQVLGAQSYYESNTLILDGYGVIRGDITKGNAVSLTMPRVFERSYFADDVNMTQLFLGQLLAISSDGSELIASAIDDAGASKLSTLLDVITNDGSQAYVSSISLADLFEPLDGQQFDLYGIQ